MLERNLQWATLANNVATLASRLNGLSIANVAASSRSHSFNRQLCAVPPPSPARPGHRPPRGGR
jgi:hypothetical protein